MRKLTLRYFYFLVPFPLLFIILSVMPKVLLHCPSKRLMLRQIKTLLFLSPKGRFSQTLTRSREVPREETVEPGGTLAAPCACRSQEGDPAYYSHFITSTFLTALSVSPQTSMVSYSRSTPSS